MSSRPPIALPWALPGGSRLVRADAPRERWLSARRDVIGGSDVAALFDVSKYGDPFTVWADKTGRSIDEPPNLAMLRGQIFEAAVIELWAEHVADFDLWIRRCGLVRSSRYPHVGATVDRLTVCTMLDTPSRCIIEAKTVSDTREWEGDELPTGFALQGGMQLLATGRDHVHFVGMGPRWQPLHRVLMRDEEFLTELGERCEQWWARHVDTDEPPQPTARSLDTLRDMHPQHTPKSIRTIDDDLAPHVHAMIDAKADAADANDRYATASALVMAAMGDAETLAWPDGEVAATWRTGRTIDGANADWKREHAEIVEAYRVPAWDFDVNKAVADHPELLTQGLRRRRTLKLP